MDLLEAFVGCVSNFQEGDTVSTHTDEIIVTMNYRSVASGFMSTHDSKAMVIYGLSNQQCAIKWIKENIAAYRG